MNNNYMNEINANSENTVQIPIDKKAKITACAQWKLKKIDPLYSPSNPNELWLCNIMHIFFECRPICVCAVVDAYTKNIISFSISQTLDINLVYSAIISAYNKLHANSGVALCVAYYRAPKFKTIITAIESLNISYYFSNTHIERILAPIFLSLRNVIKHNTVCHSFQEFEEAFSCYVESYNRKLKLSITTIKQPPLESHE